MTIKGKFRVTLGAGILIGGVAMFAGLASQDAEAPPVTFFRLVEERAVYVDNNSELCPLAGLSVAECRVLRSADR